MTWYTSCLDVAFGSSPTIFITHQRLGMWSHVFSLWALVTTATATTASWKETIFLLRRSNGFHLEIRFESAMPSPCHIDVPYPHRIHKTRLRYDWYIYLQILHKTSTIHGAVNIRVPWILWVPICPCRELLINGVFKTLWRALNTWVSLGFWFHP